MSWYFGKLLTILQVQWLKILLISHTRTVVQECCKGDDESQWRMANFDPPATP